ncbi:hypothetical protein BpHYR1_006539 [Brachionus plicatilis]|uniref:MULE transposase domain-containing protein n=1 Tax=Brachionus plicatilis TaxID=10195 RepID=A0A3M7T507_BRAPC|nr:hypothetical protein BpHYR1_006539 [Brachionus plicatilis]
MLNIAHQFTSVRYKIKKREKKRLILLLEHVMYISNLSHRQQLKIFLVTFVCRWDFEISPDIFKQLLTINFIVFRLINSKKHISVAPVYIFSDIELAIINLIRECFPSASIRDCYFHLTSNLWKHVTNSLRKNYKNDKNFKIFIFEILSLKEQQLFKRFAIFGALEAVILPTSMKALKQFQSIINCIKF